MATIQGIYIALFGRPADPLGLNYFNEQTNNGADLAAISDLAATAEYQDRFEGMSNVQIINSIYQSLFGRDADLAGLTFFSTALQNGTFNINNIAIAILDGAQNDDLLTVNNKIEAANLFTASLDTGSEVVAYQGDEAAEAGRDFLSGVTADESTVPTEEEVNAAIQAIVDDEPTGNDVNFTNAVGESLVGSAGTDTFSGVVTGAAAGTVNIGDSVDGGAGTDTLNLLVSGATTLPAGFTSDNVEVVNINYSDAAATLGGGGLNSSSFGGVEQLWQIDNVGGASFENVTVGEGVTAGFRSTGNGATAVATGATVTAAAGVTSTAVALDGVDDGSSITLAETTANGLSSATISGSVATTAAVAAVPGVDLNADGDFIDAGETAPVAAVPASSVLNLVSTAADVDTLNLSLTSNTTVSGIGAAGLDDLNTLNASGSTGNLTVALGTPDELSSATFGSGSDTVSVTTTGLNATTPTLAIDLGAGNDVLTLNAGANANANAINITLGAGNDTLDVDSLANITSTTAIDADLVTVADFNSAQDVLDLSGLTARDVLVNTELANISGAASLAAAAELAAQATTDGQYSVFNYGSDAYVLQDNGGAGFDAGDGLIKITGFAVEDITATNFIA